MAVKVCGLLGVVRGVAELFAGEGACACSARRSPPARPPCVASRRAAIGDLALLYGPDELDAQLDAKAANFVSRRRRCRRCRR